MLLLCAFLWGIAFTSQAQISAGGVGPFTCGFVRSYIAVLALLPTVMLFDRARGGERSLLHRSRRPFTRRELFGGVMCGLVFFPASFFQQAAINAGSEAGKAAFVTTLYVVFVALANPLILRRRTPPRVLLAVLLSLLGVGLLTVEAGFRVAAYDLLSLTSALCFAGHILVIDHFVRDCDGIRLSLVQFATAGTLYLLPAFLTESVSAAAIGGVILPFLYLGVVSSGIAYSLQILGQQYCPPATGAVLMSTESLFGALGGAVLLAERLAPRQYIGCAVIFLAVILAQLPARGGAQEAQ